MKRNRKNPSGFTLIEVLVTLLLMGIVLPVAMRGISVASHAADVARHTSEASSLGEAKLNELVAEGISTATSGDFGTDWPAYSWTIQTTARDYGVTEVVMTVSWPDRAGQRSLNISTMISSQAQQSSTTGVMP